MQHLAAALLIALVVPARLAADGFEVSGRVEMGLAGADGTPDANIRVLTGLDLDGRISTTTDGGLTLGIEFDLDNLLSDADTGGSASCGASAATGTPCIPAP